MFVIRNDKKSQLLIKERQSYKAWLDMPEIIKGLLPKFVSNIR